MFRSTLICLLAAELFVAPAALAKPKPDKFQRCMANCDQLKEKVEKACKSAMPGGKCDGRGRGYADDIDKKCREDCDKKKNKK